MRIIASFCAIICPYHELYSFANVLLLLLDVQNCELLYFREGLQNENAAKVELNQRMTLSMFFLGLRGFPQREQAQRLGHLRYSSQR